MPSLSKSGDTISKEMGLLKIRARLLLIISSWMILEKEAASLKWNNTTSPRN